MKLVNRVSAFFLAALALSLIGNAVFLWGLARHFLNQRFEQELMAALHTLVAAVEVEDDDAKWEPSDHAIALGAEDGLDEARWGVFDESGRLIDHSLNLQPERDPDDALWIEQARKTSSPRRSDLESGWLQFEQTLAAAHPKPPEERDEQEFASLRVVVGRSRAYVQANLRDLAILVIAVSLGVWILAALFGTWYCRRALQPVRDMAERARNVRKADFQMRLPVGPNFDELNALSVAFNSLLDQLQGAFEKQQRFTSDAAHQLRTPLTVLLGQIDVTMRRPRTTAEHVETLALLRVQTAELQQIVESLLFLARAEGEAALPTLEPRVCREWLTAYLDRWRDHPRYPDLNATFDSRPIPIASSWTLLAQALDNLIGNAFKYSDPGTPVRISLSHHGKSVVIDVEDRGIGMTREEQATIFDPFVRAQAVRQAGIPGTGLGLAISLRIAKALGGGLECESELGRGSRFRLTI